MKMQLEKLSDEELKHAEEVIYEIQKKRAKKNNTEREVIVLGVRNFLKRFADKDTIF